MPALVIINVIRHTYFVLQDQIYKARHSNTTHLLNHSNSIRDTVVTTVIFPVNSPLSTQIFSKQLKSLCSISTYFLCGHFLHNVLHNTVLHMLLSAWQGLHYLFVRARCCLNGIIRMDFIIMMLCLQNTAEQWTRVSSTLRKMGAFFTPGR